MEFNTFAIYSIMRVLPAAMEQKLVHLHHCESKPNSSGNKQMDGIYRTNSIR